MLATVERGDVSQMSFGFQTLSDEWHMEDEEEIRTLKKIKLWEVSPVTFPAYTDTDVAVRSHDLWLKNQVPDHRSKDLDRELKVLEAEGA